MEATVLFLVLYLCHRRSSWGPAIPGFDDFLTFVFPKRIFFAFMKIPFQGEDLLLLLLLLGCSLRDGGQPDFEFLHLRFYLVAIIHSDVYSSSV